MVGGVLGSRAAKNSSSSSSGNANTGNSNVAGSDSVSNPEQVSAANAASARGGANKVFYGSTDGYGNPLFISSAVDSSAPTGGSTPAVMCSDNATNLSPTNLRQHPRLIAPGYQWDCLAERISKDGYLTIMNQSVFENATNFAAMPVTNYSIDGGYTGSGILDVSREIQLRVRSWAYAYRMSGDQKWLDRTWTELVTAAGNTSTPFGQGLTINGVVQPNGHWNPAHFLDTAEMLAAYAIAYDWMYDGWNQTQRAALRNTMTDLGLTPGLQAYTTGSAWWSLPANGDGNWNCVSNAGLIMGALAILGDGGDDTTAQAVLNRAVTNIRANCFQGPYTDGTWAETANYWYFGTYAAARADSSYFTATGTALNQRDDFYKTGEFHMSVGGNAGLFYYGDNGPNKFSTNANALLWFGSHNNQPRQTLYQRDRAGALGDPLALFWYDTSAKGAYWNGLPLDRWYNDVRGSWASFRSSWTNFKGLYVGIKSSALQGHQTHGDLDAGDFVIDALGTRWAGEFGNGQYLSPSYFSNETQGSERWEYFRKGTQGQNCLVIDAQDQLVSYVPTASNQRFGSTGTSQTGDINFKPATSDTAFFVTDLSGAYNGAQAGQVKRGIRTLNGRRQVLQQDEIAAGVASQSVEWRVQTNASVSINGNTATLTMTRIVDPNAAASDTVVNLGNLQMQVRILSPAGATFTATPATQRLYGTEPYSPYPIPTDEGVTTLRIQLGTGQQTITTLWQPQWSDLGSADSATPPQVALDSWSLTSHN